MDAYQEVATAKLLDASKYNLRCNRNISEKMTKKDFIYDIPTPVQSTRKIEVQKQPIILLRRKQTANSRMPHYTIISEKLDNSNNGDATIVADQRTLRYTCNLCQEPIATLFSLSTHVKFHCQQYCKICYWILRENETMERHIGNRHRIVPEIVSF